MILGIPRYRREGCQGAILFFLMLSRLPLSPHPTDDTSYFEVTLKKRIQSPLLYDPT